MRAIRLTFTLMLLGVFAVTSAQPATCPALVLRALTSVGSACGDIGRNQACYGNLTLLATPRDPSVTLAFENPGDKVSVAAVESLQMAELAPDVPEWGVAVMALQANLPESLPGQNVTIVLFGDVQVENTGGESAPPPDVFVRSGGGVNVRQSPSTSAPIVGRVGNPEQRAVGRLADGTWLRVALDDGTDGWVSLSVVTVSGDAALLPESAPADPAPLAGGYGPMQAFRLRTGIGVPACSEAPSDGIVIQTPEGTGNVQIEVNKVTVRLGSTAVVRAVPGGTMRLTLIEGASKVSIPGNSVQLLPWQTAVIPLDASGDATGPITVEDANAADYAALPVALLPKPVDVPEITADKPYGSGIWHIVTDVEPEGVICTAADGSRTPLGFADGEGEEAIIVNSADEILLIEGTIPRTGENVFAGGYNNLPWDYYGYTSQDTFTTLTFLSPTRATAERSVTMIAPNGQTCPFHVSLQMSYVRRIPGG